MCLVKYAFSKGSDKPLNQHIPVSASQRIDWQNRIHVVFQVTENADKTTDCHTNLIHVPCFLIAWLISVV